MSAATTRSRTPDRLCAEAVDLARSAAEEAAAPGVVGEHAGVVSEGDRVVTHFFECKELGYRGWRWAVTVARASRAKVVTLDEVVLLPGPDALQCFLTMAVMSSLLLYVLGRKLRPVEVVN